jgi:hypothetical protein
MERGCFTRSGNRWGKGTLDNYVLKSRCEDHPDRRPWKSATYANLIDAGVRFVLMGMGRDMVESMVELWRK